MLTVVSSLFTGCDEHPRSAAALERAYYLNEAGAGAAAFAPPAASCGDGVVAPTEECDPAADGWGAACTESCTRVPYHKCESQEECGDPNSSCAAFRATAGSQLCAEFCVDASSCPTLPGYAASCNFAWCGLLCNDGQCPNGMDCERGFPAVDGQGIQHGTYDLCVIATPAPSDGEDAGVAP